jgi:hypothetical protein
LAKKVDLSAPNDSNDGDTRFGANHCWSQNRIRLTISGGRRSNNQAKKGWYLRRTQKFRGELDALLESQTAKCFLVSVAKTAVEFLQDPPRGEALVDKHIETLTLLADKVKQCNNSILQHCGVGEVLGKGEAAVREINEVIDGLKEVCILILEERLQESFEKGELSFQQAKD